MKLNGGKFLNAAGISGIYSAANPARRTVNILSRNWTDTNGNRRVDCNLMNFSPNGECRTFVPLRVRLPVRQRHREIRTRPARPRRGGHSGRPPDNAVRPHRAGHPGGRHGVLQRSMASRSSMAGGGAARNGSSTSASSTRSCRACPAEFAYHHRNYYNI